MMFSFMRDISSEIMVIYGLIVLVVGLIIFIMVFDKKDKRKRFVHRTQELRLMDLRRTEDDYTGEFKRQLILEAPKKEAEVQNIVEDEEEQVLNTEEITKKEDLLIDEAQYIEDDLEKTSAQIRLELLAMELEKAQEEEADKIHRFEIEQEENAIISYHELLRVCDDLYEKNEKVQYMDEGNEPINLSELKARFQQITNQDNQTYSRGKELELLD